jgi:hypothetical protein
VIHQKVAAQSALKGIAFDLIRVLGVTTAGPGVVCVTLGIRADPPSQWLGHVGHVPTSGVCGNMEHVSALDAWARSTRLSYENIGPIHMGPY